MLRRLSTCWCSDICAPRSCGFVVFRVARIQARFLHLNHQLDFKRNAYGVRGAPQQKWKSYKAKDVPQLIFLINRWRISCRVTFAAHHKSYGHQLKYVGSCVFQAISFFFDDLCYDVSSPALAIFGGIFLRKIYKGKWEFDNGPLRLRYSPTGKSIKNF